MEVTDAEVDKIDLEEGELAESGDETSEKDQPKKDEKRKASKSGSSGAGRSGKSKDSSKHKGDSSDASRSDNGPKSEKVHGGSKKSGSRSREYSKEKDSDSKKPKRKPKESPSFEDELNEYKQLNSLRVHRPSHSGDSDSGHGDSSGHSPDPHRPRGPRPVAAGPSRPPFKRRKEEFRPKEKKIPCKFFMDGRCKYGDQCPFSHNIAQTKKLEACKFYMGGYCQKGPNCVYMHNEFPCKFFHTGQRCYSGDACKFSHDALSNDQKTALDRMLEKENKDSFLRSHREAFKEGQEGQHPGDSPVKIANAFLENLSRDLLGPNGENENPSGSWSNNSRRRPEFFRETLYGEDQNAFSEERQFGEEDGSQQQNVANRPENRENGFEAGFAQDVGSPHETDSSQQHASGDVTKFLPKRQRELFLRLQQRAEHGVTRQASEPEVPLDVSVVENQEEDLYEPISDSPHRHDGAVPGNSVSKTHWNDSDDEDEGNDQVLADSLKRLQEAPKESRWSRQPAPAPVRVPFPPQNYPRAQPEHFPPAHAPYAGPPHQPYYPPPEPQIIHDRPAPFDGREEVTNRGKTLLPLPPPAREPLLTPPAPVETYKFPQLPIQGGLLAPPPAQYDDYDDPNWNYAQSTVVDPRLKSPPHPHPAPSATQAAPYPPIQQGYGRPMPAYNPPPVQLNVPAYPNLSGYPYPPAVNPVPHDAAYLPQYPNPMQPPPQYIPPYGAPIQNAPPGGLLPSMAAPADPRLLRATVSQEVTSPPQETHLPAALESALHTPTIEAVLQKLLAEKEKAKTVAVPVMQEVEASLAKNTDPPLYRLEPIEGCKPNMKEVYFRVSAHRSSEELNRDPRLSKVIPILTAEELERNKTVAPAEIPVLPAEPKEQEDSNKASLEFDAFTALLQEALGKNKKREPEEMDEKVSPTGKKVRRTGANAPLDTYS